MAWAMASLHVHGRLSAACQQSRSTTRDVCVSDRVAGGAREPASVLVFHVQHVAGPAHAAGVTRPHREVGEEQYATADSRVLGASVSTSSLATGPAVPRETVASCADRCAGHTAAGDDGSCALAAVDARMEVAGRRSAYARQERVAVRAVGGSRGPGREHCVSPDVARPAWNDGRRGPLELGYTPCRGGSQREGRLAGAISSRGNSKLSTHPDERVGSCRGSRPCCHPGVERADPSPGGRRHARPRLRRGHRRRDGPRLRERHDLGLRRRHHARPASARASPGFFGVDAGAA